MTARPEDWEILGIEPDSDVSTVRRAYRERRSLYETETLATYNLLDDEERAELVARIDTAYERIVGSSPAGLPGALHASKAAPEAEVPTGPGPDPETEPGPFIRHQRLTKGLSQHHIEAATKIGVAVIERIECEDFSALPAPVFVRGHIEQIAREIGIENPAALAKIFVMKMQGSPEDR